MVHQSLVGVRADGYILVYTVLREDGGLKKLGGKGCYQGVVSLYFVKEEEQ